MGVHGIYDRGTQGDGFLGKHPCPFLASDPAENCQSLVNFKYRRA